jgi:ABC-type nitrate/sulfonate/bicarbonate transport system substrate-binding protein
MTSRGRQWRAAIALVAAAATVSTACRPAASSAPRILRVGYAGEADFADLPSLIAQARLRARGYDVQATFFNASDVTIEAVARGSVDVVHASMMAAWSSIGRGADLKTVMNHVADPYRLIAAGGIATCGDLAGRRLALSSEAAVSTRLVNAWLADECPSATPEFLFVNESSNRALAFLAGGIDAAALELSSVLWLQAQAPARFSMLTDFSTHWPNIKTTGTHVNAQFARLHGDIVQEYVRALLDANRDALADPSLLVSAAAEYMGRHEDWAATARAYIDGHAWPIDGGLTRDDVRETLAFFQTRSHLDSKLTVDAVADLHFLERARVAVQR